MKDILQSIPHSFNVETWTYLSTSFLGLFMGVMWVIREFNLLKTRTTLNTYKEAFMRQSDNVANLSKANTAIETDLSKSRIVVDKLEKELNAMENVYESRIKRLHERIEEKATSNRVFAVSMAVKACKHNRADIEPMCEKLFKFLQAK